MIIKKIQKYIKIKYFTFSKIDNILKLINIEEVFMFKNVMV